MHEQDRAAMDIVQNNLGIAIQRQRVAHAALLEASTETQECRKQLAILERRITTKQVVSR